MDYTDLRSSTPAGGYTHSTTSWLGPKRFHRVPRPGATFLWVRKILKKSQEIERIDPKALFRAFRFRPNAPAVRGQIFGRHRVDGEEVPCQVSSSHHLWLAQNQARNVLSGALFELFLRGFTPDVRGEIRCDRTLVRGHHSPKISKPWHNY